MGKADQWSGSVWFIFSLFACYHSYKLGLGKAYEPGPGFVFFWTSVILALLSLSVLVRSFLERPVAKEEHILKKSGLKKLVPVLLALFLYALLIEYVGFIVLTLLFLIFILRAIEKKTWLFTLSMSAMVTALSYLVFEVALQSQLPKGLFEYLRFLNRIGG